MEIYLAGGMKTGWQDKVIRRCTDLRFIDPRTHGLQQEAEYTAWDLAAIDRADMVFAYMDTSNPSGFGMSLEVGYAKARGKYIWYVCEDDSARQRYFGMVRSCADRLYSSLDKALDDMAFVRVYLNEATRARMQSRGGI